MNELEKGEMTDRQLVDDAFSNSNLAEWRGTWNSPSLTKEDKDEIYRLFEEGELKNHDLKSIKDMDGGFLRRYYRLDHKENIFDEKADPTKEYTDYLVGKLKIKGDLKKIILAWQSSEKESKE